MLSSRSSKGDDRVKMKEEAKKQRIMTARAAKLPHMSRSEYRAGDLGFVSRKVAPNDEDDLSALLKNGLIDYHELLGTFRTREDYRYLGIDNVPGTPEVNITLFDDNGKNLNGFRFLRDDPSTRNIAMTRQNIKEEPSSPSNVSSGEQDRPPSAVDNNKQQQNITNVKEEPRSPKNLTNQAVCDPSSVQSNGEVVNKSKSMQYKSKPPILKMPFESSSSANASDKTHKANHCKIESILKEMTETLPPLTDIQTPVKTHDTRFPFPHVPFPKANANVLSLSGEQHNRGKSDGILEDLTITSDEESDEENERNRSSKTESILVPPKRRLSASSSSSSDGSSSDSSSDSESSDSDDDSKQPETRANKRPLHQTFASENETAINSPAPRTQNVRHGQLNSMGKRTPKGKFLKDEDLEKQVSPLNSFSKDTRKDTEASPMRSELSEISNFNHAGADILMGQSVHGAISPDKIDDLPVCSRPGGGFNVDQELTNGVYEQFPLGMDDLIVPNFDPDSIVDMIEGPEVPFDPIALPLREPDDLQGTSTINLDPLISSEFDTDKLLVKEKVKGAKKTRKISKSLIENEDSKINSSATVQSKMQSKRDKEQKWLEEMLKPEKKFDMPYINVEKLISPAKTTNALPLKVQIPLSKIHHPGKKAPQMEGGTTNSESQKYQKVKGKDISLYATNGNSKKAKCKGTKNKAKMNSSSVKCEKPRQSVGKDIEQIKSLMRELSNKASEDEEAVDVVGTPSPLKATQKPEARVSGKSIHGTPVPYVAKKQLTPQNAASSENPDLAVGLEKTKEPCKKKSDVKKGISRKRNSSSVSHDDTEDELTRVKHSKKHSESKDSVNGHVVTSKRVGIHSDDSSAGFKSPNSVIGNHIIGKNKLVVSINLLHLTRLPGISEEDEQNYCAKQNDDRADVVAEVNSVAGPVWKPPPNIKIPRLTKPPEDDTNQKSNKIGSEGSQDCADTDTSSTCSSSCKPSRDTVKSRKNRPPMDGRGVKRREWERGSKSSNTNVCGMCGSLQKDSGRDPIRLGAYKTSYVEYLKMGKRSKHRADCLDASERAPKYIDAVLKYIQYLVGLEITGKTGTKNGFEEYMCITSQCIDLVDFVVNQYGKKENNNIANYDSRFVYLCLRLQSVLYFKLYAAKKDSAARYSKLLSECFKVHRSPHRVNIKGSTGTPSPMSPTSSHTGSVASFGSSVSNGSYEKMLNVNPLVSIPSETFERMQQYFMYTKYLLHGHRLWDDADGIANQCQEFINVVARRVGAITIQSSMLHLVDYISTGLQVKKDSEKF